MAAQSSTLNIANQAPGAIQYLRALNPALLAMPKRDGGWIDLSADQHTLTPSATGTLIYSGGPTPIIGGQPVCTFNGEGNTGHTGVLLPPGVMDDFGTDPFTIIAMVKINLDTSVTSQPIIDSCYLGSSYLGISLYAYRSATTQRIYFRIQDSSGYTNLIQYAVPWGEWVVIAIRRNGTEMTIFDSSRYAATGTFITGTIGATVSASANNYTGRIGCAASGTYDFWGDMALVSVYKTALTDEEIVAVSQLLQNGA